MTMQPADYMDAVLTVEAFGPVIRCSAEDHARRESERADFVITREWSCCWPHKDGRIGVLDPCDAVMDDDAKTCTSRYYA